MTNICVAKLTNSPAIASVPRLDLDHFAKSVICQLDSPSFNQRFLNCILIAGLTLCRLGKLFGPVFAVALTSCLLTACFSHPGKKSDSGGFYGGDSAPENENRNFDKIPDAVPKREPPSKTGNKTYSALGKNFRPLKSAKGYIKRGTASWYGKKFHGRRTSSGQTYDMWAMTAAHPILPLPTYVEVTNLDTGKKIVVKVNDRGPFLHGRIIDLSYAAAHKLGIAKRGTGQVEVRALDPDDYHDSGGFTESGPVVGSIGTVGGDSAKISDQEGTASEFFVQIGAYSEFSNARSMRNMLHQKGHPVYPNSEQKNRSQGAPYKVQIGPFQNIATALQLKQSLEQLLGLSLLLITK